MCQNGNRSKAFTCFPSFKYSIANARDSLIHNSTDYDTVDLPSQLYQTFRMFLS